jgi:uncharacterized protein (DUF433 family)
LNSEKWAVSPASVAFTVYDIASYLASGMTEDEILRDFPYLEKEDFQAVYEFFASIPDGIAALETSR